MKITGVAAAMVLAGLGTAAQSPVRPPSFDAASVKPSTAPDAFARIDTTPGNVSVRNQTLRALIASAYEVRDHQIDVDAAPAWITSQRFDVVATMPRGTAPEQVSQMMQRLLADRFTVAVRRETREQPVYALSFARDDRRFGPGLTPARDPGCAQPPSDVERDIGPRCGSVSFGPGRLAGRSATWAQIVSALSRVPAVGRLVVDGAAAPAGAFDVELRWTPPNRPPGAASAETPDSIFTALQEQLGLKLTSVIAPVPVVVVLGASQPEPN
jgi:uncharacterized protein (TIGR03435 family)